VISVLPIAWVMLTTTSVTADAYRRLGQAMPMARLLVNTFLPLLPVVLLVQLPLAYLGALGIGGLRPLGKWSEWLLLPFSPWLFVTTIPLSIVGYDNLRAANLLNTFVALTPPLWFSVPMFFILTLFFKGQEWKWRAARTEGQPAGMIFFRILILPSLPLTVLLAIVALFIGAQDLWWSLLVAGRAEYYTVSMALAALRNQFASSWSVVAAGIASIALPTFVFTFLVFGVFQIFYLDRLALTTRGVNGEAGDATI